MFNKNTSNTSSSQSFIEKVKKQSKNLLKIHSNSSLSIKNLSEAQDVMAKVNGYPDWHALITTLNNSEKNIKDSNYPVSLSYYEYDKTSNNFLDSQKNLIWNDPNEISHVHGVLGLPGSGKSHIIEQTIYDTLYKKDTISNAKIAYISFNLSDKMMNILKDTKNSLLVNLSGSNPLNLSNQTWNVLDKSLGLSEHTDEHLHELSLIFSPILFKGINLNLDANIGKIFFAETLKYLECNYLNKYVLGVNKDFDKLLVDLEILNENSFENLDYSHLSYSHLSNILFLMNYIQEAEYAMRKSSFCFHDIFHLLIDNHEYKKMMKTSLFKQEQILLTDTHFELIWKNINDLMEKVPSICQLTNISIPSNTQFCHFNLQLSKHYSFYISSNDLPNTLPHDISLLFIRKEFLKLQPFYHVKPNKKITNKETKIHDYYQQFNNSLNSIFIDEIDRVFINSINRVGNIDYILKTVRECRQLSYTVTISAMNLKSLQFCQDFLTKIIISTRDKIIFEAQKIFPLLQNLEFNVPTKYMSWFLLDINNKDVIQFNTNYFDDNAHKLK